MNRAELRYLRVLHRYLQGPVAALAQEPASRHQLHALSALLARLIANFDAGPDNAMRLREAARTLRTQLRACIGDTAESAALDAALDDAADAGNHRLSTVLASVVQRLGRTDDAMAAALQQHLVEIDWRNWSAIEHGEQTVLEQAPVAAEAAAGHALLGRESAIADWLRAQCAESVALQVAEIRLIPGGFSKQTLFMKLRGMSGIPEELVLRLDRRESPLQTTVLAEYPLLKVLHASGVRVPKPVAVDDGPVAGAPLMAVTRLSGRVCADGQRFFDPPSFACAASLAQQMAAYHRIPVAQLPQGLPGHAQSVRDVMTDELRRLRTIWDETGHQSIAVEAAFNYLGGRLDLAGETRSLVHGDLRFHNLLVDGNAVSGILDWELASIGHPAFDLGYVYCHVVQLGSWSAFLDAYAAAGGVVPAAETLAYYALRTELFTVVYLTRMAADFESGRFDKIELAYAGLKLGQHAQYLLAERLRATLAGQPL